MKSKHCDHRETFSRDEEFSQIVNNQQLEVCSTCLALFTENNDQKEIITSYANRANEEVIQQFLAIDPMSSYEIMKNQRAKCLLPESLTMDQA